MTIKINPPPLQMPPEFAGEKYKNKFFSALINTVYQLWNAVYGLRIEYKVVTTDATPTAAVRVPIDSGKTIMVNAYIAARRKGGISGTDGDSAWYNLIGAYKNVSGTLTGIGTPSIVGGEDQPGWDFYFTTSGNEIVLTVLGAAGNEITWEGSLSTYTVGA